MPTIFAVALHSAADSDDDILPPNVIPFPNMYRERRHNLPLLLEMGMAGAAVLCLNILIVLIYSGML